MEPSQETSGRADAGAGTAAEATSILKSAGRDIRDEAIRTADSAKASAVRAAEEQKSFAVAFVRDLSRAFQRGSEELRESGRDRSASYVERTGNGLDRLGRQLDEKDLAALLRDTRSFVEQRPALLFCAALLAGFGLVRFSMSMPPEQRDGSQAAAAGGRP